MAGRSVEIPIGRRLLSPQQQQGPRYRCYPRSDRPSPVAITTPRRADALGERARSPHSFQRRHVQFGGIPVGVIIHRRRCCHRERWTITPGSREPCQHSQHRQYPEPEHADIRPANTEVVARAKDGHAGCRRCRWRVGWSRGWRSRRCSGRGRRGWRCRRCWRLPCDEHRERNAYLAVTQEVRKEDRVRTARRPRDGEVERRVAVRVHHFLVQNRVAANLEDGSNLRARRRSRQRGLHLGPHNAR